MDEISRYAVGLDVGTENVRAVLASVNKEGNISIIGYNELKNSGMRKGVVINSVGPSEAINEMLGEVERMSGVEVKNAYVSINGAQILSTKTEGMIAVGTVEHEINEADLERVKEVAVIGRIPANRDVLDVVSLGYAVDGQSGIKNPIGMNGARLEMKANVISALSPNCELLRKATEQADVAILGLVPTSVAAARAVLTEKQLENGVAVVDLGAATTSVAVFEEGDLQYVGAIPIGSNNVTNDLAIMLGIDTEVAEEIKRRFVTGSFKGEKNIVLKYGRDEFKFEREKVNEVVKARLNEIFERVRKELKNAHYDRKLPEGIVLVGGGAKMRDIEVYAKEVMEASVKIGAPKNLGGVAEAIEKPEYTTAVGLMLMAASDNGAPIKKSKRKEKSGGFLKKFFKKF
ncbi:cell division protein FtsA [Candidatus Saccharibacteria bacterium]|nr:cell division protein FtsA [Candidatus Saccharibacteria bacterium]